MRPDRIASGTRTVPWTVPAQAGAAGRTRASSAGGGASLQDNFGVVIAVDGHGTVVALTLSNPQEQSRMSIAEAVSATGPLRVFSSRLVFVFGASPAQSASSSLISTVRSLARRSSRGRRLAAST